MTPPRDDTGQAGGEIAPGPLGPAELQVLLLVTSTLVKQVRNQVDEYKHLLVTGTGDPNLDMTSGETKHVHLQDEDGNWHKIGSVRADKAPANAVVTDERALTRWVEENMPTEIERTIRKAALNKMKEQMKEYGGVVLSTGEVVTVPGLELEVGGPKVVVVPARGAAETFGRVYRDGRLPQVGAVLGRALEVGEGSPE